jgi:hypothetical protein
MLLANSHIQGKIKTTMQCLHAESPSTFDAEVLNRHLTTLLAAFGVFPLRKQPAGHLFPPLLQSYGMFLLHPQHSVCAGGTYRLLHRIACRKLGALITSALLNSSVHVLFSGTHCRG